MLGALVPLCALVHTHCGRVTGIAFIDFPRLGVCHPQRTHVHWVFEATSIHWSKTTVGGFYGFKLH
jgi:hypothetical protein